MNKKLMTIAMTGLLMFSSMVVFGPVAKNASASWPTVTVFAPTALTSTAAGWYYGPIDHMELDGQSLALGNGPAWAACKEYNWSGGPYTEYWPPYDNRSDLPPWDATIISVHLLTVIYCPSDRAFRLFLGIWNGTLYLDTAGSEIHDGSGWEAYEYNVTTAQSWTPALLRNNTLISIWLLTYYSGAPILVDYLGLNYTWINTTGIHGGTGNPTVETNYFIGPPGVFGLAGGVIMIVTPAAAIWIFKRQGGSRIAAFVAALACFLAGFVMFMGSFG